LPKKARKNKNGSTVKRSEAHPSHVSNLSLYFLTSVLQPARHKFYYVQ
jgi:hypothetical protein